MDDKIRLSALALACALALSACGGGGGDDSAPAPAAPTLSAAADSYTLDWNAAKRLSVQDNDGGTAGAALEIVAAPKNGTATLEGGGIVYTPAAGFLGDDVLRYRLVRNGTTAEAEVKLSVEGTLRLEGSVGRLLAGAQVTASIAERSVVVDADAQGRFALDLKTAKPTEFVGLTAKGAGAKSRIVYDSLLGEAGGLGKRSVQGKLGTAQMPELFVNVLSSATAGLLSRQGPLPTTDAQLSQGLAKLNSREIVDTAALLISVADLNMPLPAGVATTQALVRDAAAQRALERQRWANEPALLTSLRKSLADDTGVQVAPPTPTEAPVTLIYGYGAGGGVWGVQHLTLQPNGKAVLEGTERTPATWTLRGTTLAIVFDQPDVEQRPGPPWSTTNSTTGLEIREFAAGGAAVLRWTRTVVDGGGGNAGVVRDNSTAWKPVRRLIDTATPLRASDFAVGTRWAGPYSVLAAVNDPERQDMLEITGPNTGRMEGTGTPFTWTVADGVLEVVLPTATHRYRRIALDAAGGERWLMEQRSSTGSMFAEMLVVAAGEVGREEAVGRIWETNQYVGIYGGAERFALRADGRAAVSLFGYGVSEYKHDDLKYEFGLRRPNDKPVITVDLYVRPEPQCFTTGCPLAGQIEFKVVAKRGSTLFVLLKPIVGDYYRSSLVTLTDLGEAK